MDSMQSLLHSLLLVLLAPVTLGFALDWSYYHKTEEILDACKNLALQNPSKARFEELPDTETQFRLPVLTITHQASGEANKDIILLIAGEHSRELITSEIALWLSILLSADTNAQNFTQWSSTRSAQATARKAGWEKGTLSDWADTLLQKVAFKIVPVLNIAGRKAVESGSTCLRKTISGVDLNRNWPFAWQKTGQDLDEYGGPAPFSEPESRVIRAIAQNQQPRAYVNLHSGEWAMYTPWDSKAEHALDLPADTDALLEKMNAYCECMKGPAGKVAGYLAFGSSMDWMYTEQHVPYPLTFEVYGPKDLGKLSAGGHPRRALHQIVGTEDLATSAGLLAAASNQKGSSRQDNQISTQSSDEDCLPAYNPVTLEGYQSVVASWVGTLLVLADHLAANPRVGSAANFHAEQLQQPENKEEAGAELTALSRESAQEMAETTKRLAKEEGLNNFLGRKNHLPKNNPAKPRVERLQQRQGSEYKGGFVYYASRVFLALIFAALVLLYSIRRLKLRPTATTPLRWTKNGFHPN